MEIPNTQAPPPPDTNPVPFKMPVLFKARVMEDGFAFIVCYNSDARRFEVGIKDGSVRINLDRESMSALRDVLTAALQPQT